MDTAAQSNDASMLRRPAAGARKRGDDPSRLPTSMGFVEVAAALLTLVILLSASVHTRSDAPLSRSVQVTEATLHAAHLLHADAPWAAQVLNDQIRIHAPSEDGLESTPRLAYDPVEEVAPQSPISILGTDRPTTLRDLSEAVHPDRTHAPPFLS